MITVTDDGIGLPPDFDPQVSGNLGLQIVRTLVGSELAGRFDMVPNPSGGTIVTLDLQLRQRR